MENMGGVRHLIDRHPLGPRLRRMIADIEEQGLKVDDPPAEGVAEVNELLTLVDGRNLIAGVLACIVSVVPLAGPADEGEGEGNDNVLAEHDGHKLIDRGGGHYSIVTSDGDETKIRGREAAENLFAKLNRQAS